MIAVLRRLKGVGQTTAQRFALELVNDPTLAHDLAVAAEAVPSMIAPCARCNYLAQAGGLCSICLDNKRNPLLLCVVHKVEDVLAFEQSMAWRGRYFVMNKLLNPLEGIGSGELPLGAIARVVATTIDEIPAAAEAVVVDVVLALPPSVDGNATAAVVADFLGKTLTQVLAYKDRWILTRPAQGLGHGAEISFAGAATLQIALLGRKEISKGR